MDICILLDGNGVKGMGQKKVSKDLSRAETREKRKDTDIEKGELIYEEDTKNHIDDIWISRKDQYRKEGKVITLIVTYTFLPIVIIFVFTIGIFNLTREGSIWERLIFIGAGLFLISIILSNTKLLFGTENLKIYSKGISLPERTLKEWYENKEHYIPFKSIKEIYFERRHIEIKNVQLMPIEFRMNNSSKEKINPVIFRDINKIGNILKERVKIVNKEYTSEDLIRNKIKKSKSGFWY
jgi:hypothetical protein